MRVLLTWRWVLLRWCVYSLLLAASPIIINFFMFLILVDHPAWTSLFTEGQFFLLATGLAATTLSVIASTEGWRRLIRESFRESINGFNGLVLTFAVAGFTAVAAFKVAKMPVHDSVVIIMSVVIYLAAIVTSGLSVILAETDKDNGT